MWTIRDHQMKDTLNMMYLGLQDTVLNGFITKNILFIFLFYSESIVICSY